MKRKILRVVCGVGVIASCVGLLGIAGGMDKDAISMSSALVGIAVCFVVGGVNIALLKRLDY